MGQRGSLVATHSLVQVPQESRKSLYQYYKSCKNPYQVYKSRALHLTINHPIIKFVFIQVSAIKGMKPLSCPLSLFCVNKKCSRTMVFFGSQTPFVIAAIIYQESHFWELKARKSSHFKTI